MKKIFLFIVCAFFLTTTLNAKDYKDEGLYFSIPDNWKETESTNENGTIKYSFVDYGHETLQQISVTKEPIENCDEYVFSNGAVRQRFNLGLDIDVEQENINGIFFEKFAYLMPVGDTSFNSVNYVSVNECSLYRLEYSYVRTNTMEEEFRSIVETLKFKKNQLPINDQTVAIVNALRVAFSLVGIIIIFITLMYAKNYFQAQKQKKNIK